MKVTSFYTNYRYNSEMWREQKDISTKSQQARIDISELKKLHQDLVQMLQTQSGRITMVISYKIGERVYLWTDNIKIKWVSKKLNHQSIESFMIKRNIKNLSYELDLSMNMRIHSVFHAFMLQLCDQFILLQTQSISVESDEEYEVERILDKKIISGTAHYLVKWKEYNISESTWKSRMNLRNCTRMLQQFEREVRQIITHHLTSDSEIVITFENHHSQYCYYHQSTSVQGTRFSVWHNLESVERFFKDEQA